jgi:hypothetical protein
VTTTTVPAATAIFITILAGFHPVVITILAAVRPAIVILSAHRQSDDAKNHQ